MSDSEKEEPQSLLLLFFVCSSRNNENSNNKSTCALLVKNPVIPETLRLHGLWKVFLCTPYVRKSGGLTGMKIFSTDDLLASQGAEIVHI